MKYTKLFIKPRTGFLESMNLVMDEMYEIGRFIAKFE